MIELPKMSGGEAAVGRKDGHESAGGVDVGPLFEFEERLQPARHAGVAERHAIRKAECAHHQVIHRPRAEPAHGEERALGARGGHHRQRREIELPRGDESRGGDNVVRFLPGELQRKQVRRFERCDAGRRGRSIKAVGQRRAGALDEATFKEAREGEIDLLSDDRPQQSVKDGGCLADAQFGAVGHEPGEAEFLGESREGGRVLIEAEQADNNRMGFGRRTGGDFHSDSVRVESEREQGRTGAELHGGSADVVLKTLGHTVDVATECASEIAEQEIRRQQNLEGTRCGESAVGGGSESVELAEMLVKDGERLEADFAGYGRESGAGGEEFLLRDGDAGPHEQISRGRVVVEPKEFKDARGAEARAAHDGLGVGEFRGGGAHFGDERLDRFEDGIGAAGEIVGMTFLAGPQSGRAGGFAGGEEADVFGFRFPRLAGGQAVDAGRQHAGEKAAVVGGVAGEHARIHGGIGHSHGLTLARGLSRVVREISEQFFGWRACHCEERSDEAIQLDCRARQAGLAMTNNEGCSLWKQSPALLRIGHALDAEGEGGEAAAEFEF